MLAPSPLGVCLMLCPKENSTPVRSCAAVENYQQERKRGIRLKTKAPFTRPCIPSSTHIYYVLIMIVLVSEKTKAIEI